MRCDEICEEIQAESPPDGSKDVASDFPHSPHQAYAVVNLGEELEQDCHQKQWHYQLNLLFLC